MLLEDCKRFLPVGACCPEQWAAWPEGEFLARREQAMFDAATAEVFGYYALQIGDPHRDLLSSSPILHKYRIGLSGRCNVRADAASFPFESGAADLVALAHALEFSVHARDIVREACRVLRPEGHMVVLCFNSASLLGLRKVCGLSGLCGGYPWHGEFFSVQRLADWLGVLGMAVIGGGYAGYAPARVPDWLRTKFEAAGDRWWPLLGNVIMLHAVKRQPALRLRPLWGRIKRKAEIRGAVAGTGETRRGGGV